MSWSTAALPGTARSLAARAGAHQIQVAVNGDTRSHSIASGFNACHRYLTAGD